MPFDKLPAKERASHLADATEVFRTLSEFGFVVSQSRLPMLPLSTVN